MQTLPNGVVIPEGSDRISASGVDEVRALGTSVDAALREKAPIARVLTVSDSLNNLDDGWYRFDATSTPAALGIPVEGSQQWLLGEFHQFSVYGNDNYKIQEYRQLNGRIVRRVRDTSVWGEWEAGDGTLISTPPPSASHEMRVQAFKDDYPLVSTEGKGVVVLRFDHGLTNFKSTIWPLLQQHQVKAYIAMNSRLWGIGENSGATQADAQAWIASGLVEFGNHTADHVDRNTAGGIYDTIVNGRRELETQLGTVIHGFTVPGLSEFDQLEGFGAGTNTSYSNTYAGGLILANHAIASGSVGYVNRTLDGQVRQGGRHFTWESATWTYIKSLIDQAVTNQTAITLMAHPREMGREGYFDAALLEQVIEYIRERIDAGDLADISYYQSHHATTRPVDGTGDVIPAGTDWDTLTTAKTWAAPVSGMGYANAPYSNFIGSVMVLDAQNSTGNIQFQVAIGYNPVEMFMRQRNTSGTWTGWRQLGVDDPTLTDSGAGRRSAVVDAGLRRRGRKIGTRGRAAVALRFDHHLDSWESKVLPLLRKHRLPWGQMLNAGNIGSGDDNMTPTEIAEACHSSGGEVWNHSWSHVSITTTSQADREISRGLSDLRDALPDLWIDAWAPPGTSGYMGMDGSDTPEKLWGSYPGRLVLAQHALIRGYYSGIYQPLTGDELIGQAHAVLDEQDEAWAGAVLRGAIRTGTGVTFMLHPNYLDQPGYMTTAQLDAVLADIAARRDAGELVVLSPAGILLADSNAPRQNILSGAGPGDVETSWSQSVTSRLAARQYGVPHEATAVVEATTSGTITLNVQITHPGGVVDESHTITATTGGIYRLGVPVTPPLSTTQTTITLNGAVTHTGIRYGAV